jgi:hypothetical protein
VLLSGPKENITKRKPGMGCKVDVVIPPTDCLTIIV